MVQCVAGDAAERQRTRTVHTAVTLARGAAGGPKLIYRPQ